MKMKNIKTTLMTAALIFTMSVANAQVFLDENYDENTSPRSGTKGDANGDWLVVPTQGSTSDQYDFAPVGSGVLFLAGMAGAYAFAKRRKN